MALDRKRLLVCNCEGTMALDGRKLARACGLAGEIAVHSHLCRSQVESFNRAAGEGRELLVACTQEAPLFEELRAEAAPETAASYTNIRERAGWSEQGARALPKIAALLAEAALDIEPARSVALKSEGRCLVYGRDEAAIEAAKQLHSRLSVTVLLTRPADVIPPRVVDVPIFKGTIKAASGHLGAFALAIDDHSPMVASSRTSLAFEPARDGMSLECDLILDLAGGSPLFPAADKRDGYFRPDPGNPGAVQRALFELVDLVGEFEKPRYVAFNAELCAHSRNQRVGCTRCLEVCPASAITPAGDVVHIDPYLCGGCGACNSVCPTGAAAYDHPSDNAILERQRTLLRAYLAAGGTAPVLLVHDPRHGDELISLMSRFGRGVPAHVLPFAVNEVTQLGFVGLAGAFAYGATQLMLLVPPKRRAELSGLEGEIALVDTVLDGLGYGAGRLELLVEDDPDVVEERLYGLDALDGARPAGFLPMGTKRQLMRQVLQHLHTVAPAPVDELALPASAPFGTLRIDVDGCTLCHACVGVCPTGALQDNPELPQLRFQEEACVQCGLCVATCPEHVIALQPRLNFQDDARRAVLVKEEEPFHCIRCGKPFGTKSSIERIIERLEGRHWMFPDSAALDRIRMCEDCRVVAHFEAGQDPFAGPPRRKTYTTEDHLREREIEEARAKVRAEREREKKDEG